MAVPHLAADGASIVIRGRFRAELLSPKWLLDQGLINSVDAQDAQFTMLVPTEIAAFSAGWFRCEVHSESLQITTNDEADFERMRDLAVGILRALPDTPISLLGINRMVHFVIGEWVKWHAVGDRLARNDVWEGVLANPGMRSLTTSGSRTDNYWGRVQVQVEPSNVFPYAIFVAYNDHFDLTTTDGPVSSRKEAALLQRTDDIEVTSDKIPIALQVLTTEWSASMRRSADVIERIARQAEVKE